MFAQYLKWLYIKEKKTGWKGSVKVFSIDYNAINTSNISDIHRCLIKNTWYKIIFGIIKKIFIVLLTSCINTSSIGNASNHTKCVSANNQKCEI